MNLLDYIRITFGRISFLKNLLAPFNKLIRKYLLWRMNRSYMKYGEITFRKFVETLNSSNLKFWPEFGTLLGIFREGDFIKHDNDFDFGVYIDDADRVYSSLKEAGFKLEYLYYSPVLSYVREETYSYKGVHIDVFYFNQQGNNDICYTFLPDSIDGLKRIRYKIKEFSFERIDLKSIVFKNLRLTIPKETQHHLVVSYGPHFMVPDPSFKSINHNFIEGHYAYRSH